MLIFGIATTDPLQGSFAQAALSPSCASATPSLASCPQYAISDGDLAAAAETGAAAGAAAGDGLGAVILCRALLGLWLVLRRV